MKPRLINFQTAVSLVEIMIAFAVFSLVGIMAAQILKQYSQTESVESWKSATTSKLQTGLNTLARHLESCYSVLTTSGGRSQLTVPPVNYLNCSDNEFNKFREFSEPVDVYLVITPNPNPTVITAEPGALLSFATMTFLDTSNKERWETVQLRVLSDSFSSSESSNQIRLWEGISRLSITADNIINDQTRQIHQTNLTVIAEIISPDYLNLPSPIVLSRRLELVINSLLPSP